MLENCFLKYYSLGQFLGKLLLEDGDKILLLSFDRNFTFFKGLGLKDQSLGKLEVFCLLKDVS